MYHEILDRTLKHLKESPSSLEVVGWESVASLGEAEYGSIKDILRRSF